MAEPARLERRRAGRSFAPTVLLGVAAAALTAVSASQDWAKSSGSAAGVDVSAAVKGSASAPLAIALALVALAAWGVVLVLRGRVRRAVAVVGAAASAGVLAAALSVYTSAQDDAVRAVVARGGTGDAFSSSLTAWYYVSLVAAVVTLAGFVVAVVAAPGWPAMGSRYDAPATRSGDQAGATAAEGPVAEQDMWKALDDGRDPTA
jgi:uncharacterized membrane protein (TIGR02234 family)